MPRYNYGDKVPTPTVLDYFASEVHFMRVLADADARTRSQAEKDFVRNLTERIGQHRMNTYMSSRQASWLTRLARRPAKKPRPLTMSGATA